MFSANRYVRRSANPLGKHKSVPPLGVQTFSECTYRGYVYQIGRRTLGMTVRRAAYSVTIRAADGGEGTYLTDLQNLDAARQAAEQWIDLHASHQSSAQLKQWESLLEHAQARQRRVVAQALGGGGAPRSGSPRRAP